MIRAVVVEDEPHARAYLVSLLHDTRRVVVVGEAEEAGLGLKLCSDPDLDVAFLDIGLPGDDGLALAGVISERPSPPLLVFVTGDSAHAVDAFRVQATDYLLKPIDSGRVARTVERLSKRLDGRAAAAANPAAPAQPLYPVRHRSGDTASLLKLDEIVAVMRKGRRTWIHTRDAEYATYEPVSAVEESLAGANLFRASRSLLVNLLQVRKIVHFGDRLYQLELADRNSTVVRVSRSRASILSALLRTRG